MHVISAERFPILQGVNFFKTKPKIKQQQQKAKSNKFFDLKTNSRCFIAYCAGVHKNGTHRTIYLIGFSPGCCSV